ncbi:hypothetical protein ACJZ2D_011509 [Fusarium nematophilum]
MLRIQTLLLALWAGHCVGFGGETLQLARGPAMAALSEAEMNDLSVLDIAANLSTWLDQDSTNLNFDSLQPRALECVDAGYWNTRQCGSSKCYDPSTQKCCSNGSACRKSETCVAGGCCMGDEIACGSRGCYNPDTSVCCRSTGRYCPKGYDCMEGGGCCPSGQKRCGNSKCYNPRTQTCCTGPGTVWACPRSNDCCTGGFCRDPSTEKCCENGSCKKDTTCCDQECCRSIAYCGSDGFCKPCPAETRTVTSTVSSTTTRTRTVRVTSDITADTGDAPEFTCVPMTATNDEGATLELDEGCALHYEPPEATTTGSAAALLGRGADLPPAKISAWPAGLLGRQLSCTPFTTVTRTSWVTKPVTVTSTRTTMIQGQDEGFSCAEMEVTNTAGDVLALDESCALSFSPATPTSTAEDQEPAATAANDGGGGGSSSQDDNSGSVTGVSLPVVGTLVGIVVLWLVG